MPKENGQENRSVPAFVCGEIGLVQSLGMAGIPVYVGSEFTDNVALSSRYAKKKMLLPSYDSEEFINELLKKGKIFSEKPVLLTDSDQALLAISRRRELLNKYYRFTLPDKQVVEQVHNKEQFYEAADRYGLPVPSSYTVTSQQKLAQVADELQFPCVVKPADTKHWLHQDFSQIVGPYRKAIHCANMEELRRVYQKVSGIHSTSIVQESIEGEDHRHYSINMFLSPNKKLKGYYIYQKLRMYPIGAGRGSFFETVYDIEILEQALKAADAFKMRGLMNIQFKRDSRTDELKLIEMEPRLSVSSFLGPASGMNLAVRYYVNLINESPPKTNHSYQSGIKYADLLRDIKAFAHYRREDKLSFWDWISSYRGRCVYNGYLLRDPCPILKRLWFVIRRRLNGKKAWRTKKNLSASCKR